MVLESAVHFFPTDLMPVNIQLPIRLVKSAQGFDIDGWIFTVVLILWPSFRACKEGIEDSYETQNSSNAIYGNRAANPPRLLEGSVVDFCRGEHVAVLGDARRSGTTR